MKIEIFCISASLAILECMDKKEEKYCNIFYCTFRLEDVSLKRPSMCGFMTQVKNFTYFKYFLSSYFPLFAFFQCVMKIHREKMHIHQHVNHLNTLYFPIICILCISTKPRGSSTSLHALLWQGHFSLIPSPST